MDFTIDVNGRSIKVTEGETLLNALHRNGIRIPTLCHMNRLSPSGACRLCVVEVEGKRDLITSCSYPVEKDMKVLTNSQRVIKARKSLVELLLSNHPDDCLYCERNGQCELQWLAEEMNVKERKFFGKKNQYFPDNSSSSVARDPAKCILCGRCVRICEEIQLVTAIDFIGRSNVTTINSAFQKGLNDSTCIDCGQCITVCPTGALIDISHIEKVQSAINNKGKRVAFMVSPSVVASFAEEYNLKPGPGVEGIVAAALKKCGADYVFNMGFGIDQNITGEAMTLLERLASSTELPCLSACCPAWVKYIELFRPEWMGSLTKLKSPQQIMGSMVKFGDESNSISSRESMYTVSVTPCVANKFEASREEMTHRGISEVDAILTIREFFRFVRTHGIDMKNIEAESMDTPYQHATAASWKTGYSGGKAEAVALEAFLIAGGNVNDFKFTIPKNTSAKKETKVVINNQPIGFAWVSGIAEADSYLQSLFDENRSDIHYIEVMACPRGCVGGGGQPINRSPEKPKSRKKMCQELEKFAHTRTPFISG